MMSLPNSYQEAWHSSLFSLSFFYSLSFWIWYYLLITVSVCKWHLLFTSLSFPFLLFMPKSLFSTDLPLLAIFINLSGSFFSWQGKHALKTRQQLSEHECKERFLSIGFYFLFQTKWYCFSIIPFHPSIHSCMHYFYPAVSVGRILLPWRQTPKGEGHFHNVKSWMIACEGWCPKWPALICRPSGVACLRNAGQTEIDQTVRQFLRG